MEKSKPPNSQAKAAPQQTRADDAQEIERLDAILQRMRKRTPTEPYIVSTPSDMPYNVSHSQRDDFRRGTAFGRGEAKLDYMSFLYRDTSHNILCLEAQDSFEDKTKLGVPPSTRASHPSTPAMGPKKKISLADYKNRAEHKHRTASHVSSVAASPAAGSQTHQTSSTTNGETKRPEAEPVAVHSAPSIATDDQTDEPPKIVPSDTRGLASSTSPVKNPDNAKFSSPGAMGQTTTDVLHPNEVSHNGKRELSSHADRPEGKPQVSDVQSHDKNDKPHSEGAPERKHEQQSTSRDEKPKNAGAVEVTDTVPSPRGGSAPPPVVRVAMAEGKVIENDDGAASGDESLQAPAWSPLTSVGSLSPSSLQMSAATSRSSATSTELSISLPTDAAIEAAKKHMTTRSTSGRNQQVWKDPAQQVQETAKSDKVDANGVSASKAADNAPAKTGKRSRDDEDSAVKPDSKRRKTLEAAGGAGPRTPETKAMKPSSASISNNGLLTPSRPTGDSSKGAISENAPTPDLKASEKRLTGTAKKWREESTKLHGTGKQLRKEYSTSFEASKTAKRGSEKAKLVKSSLVKGLESALSFMLSFCAQGPDGDYNRSWRGTITLLEEIKSRASDFSPLKGLCNSLIATCARRSIVLLSKTDLADLEKPITIEEHYAELQKCIRRSEQCVAEAEKLLPKAVLLKRYPATCEASESSPMAAPTTISMIRMSLVFLGEWSKQQGVTWTPPLEEGVFTQL